MKEPNVQCAEQVTVIGEGRLILAGFYLGQGLSFEETSEKVGVSEGPLRAVMNHFGVKGRNVGKGARRMSIIVTSDSMPLISSASGLRGVEDVEVVERVIREAFSSPDLLRNILDDGREVR